MYVYHAFFKYSDIDKTQTSALCHVRIFKIPPDDDNFANICKNLDIQKIFSMIIFILFTNSCKYSVLFILIQI